MRIKDKILRLERILKQKKGDALIVLIKKDNEIIEAHFRGKRYKDKKEIKRLQKIEGITQIIIPYEILPDKLKS